MSSVWTGAGLGFKAAAADAALLLQDGPEIQLYTHGVAERNGFEKRAGVTALPSIIASVPDSGLVGTTVTATQKIIAYIRNASGSTGKRAGMVTTTFVQKS